MRSMRPRVGCTNASLRYAFMRRCRNPSVFSRTRCRTWAVKPVLMTSGPARARGRASSAAPGQGRRPGSSSSRRCRAPPGCRRSRACHGVFFPRALGRASRRGGRPVRAAATSAPARPSRRRRSCAAYEAGYARQTARAASSSSSKWQPAVLVVRLARLPLEASAHAPEPPRRPCAAVAAASAATWWRSVSSPAARTARCRVAHLGIRTGARPGTCSSRRHAVVPNNLVGSSRRRRRRARPVVPHATSVADRRNNSRHRRPSRKARKSRERAASCLDGPP